MRFNGSTFFDRTNYFETFTASDENLDWALAMEADRMVNSFVAKKDLDTEMTVVRNEYESGENNPQRVLWGRMQATAYDWHNYGNLTIGARSDIENVDIGRLQAFYKLYYQPDNAVLIVAGHVRSRSHARADREDVRPDSEARRARCRVLYTKEPVQDGERSVTVRRAGGAQFVAALYHTVPGAHPDAIAMDALGEVMTVEPAGRLYKALVETKKASAVESWNFVLPIRATSSSGRRCRRPIRSPPRATRCIATVEGVKAKPITAAEVDRVRAKALRQFDETFNDPQKLGVAISESIATGDWRLFFLQRDHWRKLTPADVQRVALEYLKPVEPDGRPVHSRLEARSRADAARRRHRGDGQGLQGRSERRRRRIVRADAGQSRGAHAALHAAERHEGRAAAEEDARRDGAAADAPAPGRREVAAWACRRAASLAASMLTLGTKKRDRQAFEDTLDRLRAKLSIGGGETETVGARPDGAHASAGRSCGSPPKRCASPRSRATEFEKLKRERLASLEESSTDPQSIARARARALEQSLSARATSATCRRSTRSSRRSRARSSTT